jgi:hypothetical protein
MKNNNIQLITNFHAQETSQFFDYPYYAEYNMGGTNKMNVKEPNEYLL